MGFTPVLSSQEVVKGWELAAIHMKLSVLQTLAMQLSTQVLTTSSWLLVVHPWGKLSNERNYDVLL